VPVFDGKGVLRAAINLSAHAARVSKATLLRDYLPQLRAAAARISAAMT
jgi:IclR family pca regulon transcriptional regulator